MKNFSLGALNDWVPLGMGELVSFETPQDTYRMVDFDLVTDGHVAVVAYGKDRSWLVAAGHGQFCVKFGISEGVTVSLHGDEAVTAMLRTKDRNQALGDEGEPTFTTIQPRNTSAPDVVKQMWQLMQVNNLARDQELRRLQSSLRDVQRAQGAAAALDVIDTGDKPAKPKKAAVKPAEEKPKAQEQGEGAGDDA